MKQFICRVFMQLLRALEVCWHLAVFCYFALKLETFQASNHYCRRRFISSIGDDLLDSWPGCGARNFFVMRLEINNTFDAFVVACALFFIRSLHLHSSTTDPYWISSSFSVVVTFTTCHIDASQYHLLLGVCKGGTCTWIHSN